MKAVLWEGRPFEMVVREVPRPKIQTPRDVIVRVTTAAICGSDLHTFHGILGGDDVPYEMGHEAVGIVHEVGSEVISFKKGDRVVVPDLFQIGGQEFIYGGGDEISTNIGGCQGKF